MWNDANLIKTFGPLVAIHFGVGVATFLAFRNKRWFLGMSLTMLALALSAHLAIQIVPLVEGYFHPHP